MDWIHNNEPVVSLPEGTTGFVYIITNLTDGRKYIGKKKATFKKTSQKTIRLKTTGEKRKKKIRSEVESDWRDYYGSSDELKKDLETLGAENFKREILKFCHSLSELSYYEAKYQFESDCLLHPSLWYNSWISVRVRRDHMIRKRK